MANEKRLFLQCDAVEPDSDGKQRQAADQLPNRVAGRVEWSQEVCNHLAFGTGVQVEFDPAQVYRRVKSEGVPVYGAEVLRQLAKSGALTPSLNKTAFIAWGDLLRSASGLYVWYLSPKPPFGARQMRLLTVVSEPLPRNGNDSDWHPMDNVMFWSGG